MQLRLLTGADIARALPMPLAIEGMKRTYLHLSAGEVSMPLRSRVEIPQHAGATLTMSAHVCGDDALAVKVVSVFHNNPLRQLPLIYGIVLALDATTGQPLALLDGASLTAIRTGAASGAATDALARPDAAIAAIIGSGAQARAQLEGISAVRRLRTVRVYSRNPQHAAAFAQEMGVEAVSTPAEAIRDADIICTATASAAPVFDGHDLKPGAHINAIGSFTAEMQEVDVETIRRALVVVDSRESALAEAGDLVIPIRNGEVPASHIHAELGEILAGRKRGRTSPNEITYFKSCGLAVQDAVAANIVLKQALAANLGAVVNL